MNTLRNNVMNRHTFTRETLDVFALAERIAEKRFEDRIFSVHVFVACVYLQPEIMRLLLGREIAKLPKKYDIGSELVSNEAPGSDIGDLFGKEEEDGNDGWAGAEDGMDFSDELALIFLDDTQQSTIQMLRNYSIEKHIGAAEVAVAVMMEPSEEIGDILMENGFPNDARQLGEMLQENYLRHIRVFSNATPRERLTNAVSMAKRFRDCMAASIFGQKQAIEDVCSILTSFWFSGNYGKPLTILLLSKPGGGRSYFASTMQQAFVDLGLQNAIDSPIDMSGMIHDQCCEPDLLGDAKSYRNARPGLLHKKTEHNKRGAIVFEDILDGCGVASNILRSFASNQALDKYYEKTIMIPYNIIVLTMRITQAQYKYLEESKAKEINAKVLNKLFRAGEEEDPHMEKAAHNSEGLWQCVSKTILLEDLSEQEMHSLAENRIGMAGKRLKADYGLELHCNDQDRLIALLMQSLPDNLDPGELVEKIDETFRGLWKVLNDHFEIEKVELNCDELPEYQYDSKRRTIRGDYLDYEETVRIQGKKVCLSFEKIHYVQMERMDCGDYTIEHPKSITFDDIIGLDDVRDELMDSLNYITNRDKFTRKTPKACQNYILFGKPGNGKTSLATSLANKADVPVFFVPNSTFTNPLKLRALFKKAEEQAPAVIVLEEINTIGNSVYGRRDAINELLSILDGPQKHSKLLILASTNHLEQIEPALLRPGRFGRQIEIGLPNEKARKTFVRKFEEEYEVSIPEDAMDELVIETEGCSMAELKGILGYALRLCIRENKPLDLGALLRSVSQFKKPSDRAIGFT